MTERTPVNPESRESRDDVDPAAHQPTTPYPASPAGWGAAPTPTSTATLDAPAPAPEHPYATPAPSAGSWNPGAPNGATPWYGSAATPRRGRGPRPPWFWQVLAVGVGLAALLVGGGIGFAIGHAIGGGTSQSTTQVPGTNGGTNQFPGGGTGQFPGNGTQGGTGTGSGTGSDTSGSSANS
ncbi:hypothetical protein [Curtobacterium sp. USHLN213]|uniref:hypothetical protein n=1 Tax=Curtobacterium sp. USHLN213 TaxID=3081255 RepID=UPI00301B52AC